MIKKVPEEAYILVESFTNEAEVPTEYLLRVDFH